MRSDFEMYFLRPGRRRLLRALFLGLWIAGFLSAGGFAWGVSLEWDRNEEPTVTGYKVYYGTASRAYSKTVNAGNSTTATVEDLITGTTYYFVVTAYDATGTESPPSNEVSFVAPVPVQLAVTSLPADLIQKPGVNLVPTPGPLDKGFVLAATSPAGTKVSVWASEDLKTWTLLGTVSNPTGRMLITDPSAKGKPTRYYRVGIANSN